MKQWLNKKRENFLLERRFSKVLKESEKKNTPEAVEHLLKFIHEEPNKDEYKAEAYLKIAYLYEKEHQIEHAVKFFDLSFEVARDIKFDYVKEIDQIFDLFVQAERHELYEKWHENFTQRAQSQKSFKKFVLPKL